MTWMVWPASVSIGLAFANRFRLLSLFCVCVVGFFFFFFYSAPSWYDKAGFVMLSRFQSDPFAFRVSIGVRSPKHLIEDLNRRRQSKNEVHELVSQRVLARSLCGRGAS
jgi:hypothetical protein